MESFFSPPISVILCVQHCIIKKIGRPHLEKNSTASRRGGGSASGWRPQPGLLHNCGFSDFRFKNIPPPMDESSAFVKPLFWILHGSGYQNYKYYVNWNDFGTVSRSFVCCFCTVTDTDPLCSFPTAGKHVWEILIIMTQLLHLKGNKWNCCCHVWVKEPFLPYVSRNQISWEYLTSQLPADRHSSKTVWASYPARYTNMSTSDGATFSEGLLFDLFLNIY